MADLTTFTLTAVTTHSSGSPTYDTFAPAWTAFACDEWYKHRVEAALTPGSVLGLTHFAAVNHLIITNLDGTNFVTVEWDDAAADTNTVVVAAGKMLVIPDLDPSASVTIVADTAACLCDVLVVGS